MKHINENIAKLVDELPYKKILVWCGLISHAENLRLLFQECYPNFLIAVDTSNTSENLDKFYNVDNNAILFVQQNMRRFRH